MAGLSSRVIQSPRLLSTWVSIGGKVNRKSSGLWLGVQDTQVQVLVLLLLWVSDHILEGRELSTSL